MTDDKQASEPAQAPRRKWKQSEALRAIEILKALDMKKWEEYVHEELNGAQISDDLGLWMFKTLAPEFNSDLREIVGLFSKIRTNTNPKWVAYSGDDQ